MRLRAIVCRLTGEHRWAFYGHASRPCDCSRCGTPRGGCNW